MYSIILWWTMFGYLPAKSNPKEPSLASMRDENLLLGLRSTSEGVGR